MAVDLASRMNDMADAVRQRWGGNPRAGVILGTGLGGLAEQIDAEAVQINQVPEDRSMRPSPSTTPRFLTCRPQPLWGIAGA